MPKRRKRGKRGGKKHKKKTPALTPAQQKLLLALNNQDDLLENGLDVDNLPTEVANNYKNSDISESQLYTPADIADMAKPIGN
jgi:hypothetical protein